jgi:hypothetical protein
MDLTKLSTEDLRAMQSGDLSKVSSEGLMSLRGQDAPKATPKVTLGPEGFAQSVREELDSKNNPLARFAMGVSGTVDDSAIRLKQMFGNSSIGKAISGILGVSFDMTPEEQQSVIANRVNREGLEGMAGAVTGGIAMTGGPAAALQRGITGQILPQGAGALARTVAPTVSAGATGAALSTATSPVLPGESEITNTALGAAGGVAGDAAGRVLRRVLQPVIPTPDAQRLINEGVQPTPGQATGANSLLGRVEQQLQSIPFVGGIIRNARGRATDEFNVAAIRRSLPANDKGEITKPGREALQRAEQILSDGYDDVLTKIGSVRVDAPLQTAITRIAQDPDLALPQTQAKRFVEILKSQFDGRIQNGAVNADMAKRIDSQLGQISRGYSGSPDRDTRALGQALGQARDAWRDSFGRSASDPADAQTLKELNGHWANLVRVERAAGSQGASSGDSPPGVFTAAQLSNAVRATDKSVRKKNTAQGKALMQDLSDSGRQVLDETVRNSGTTDRALMAGLTLGAAGGAADSLDIGPGGLSALALAPLLYSRAGSRLATGQLTPGMIQALQQAGPGMTNLGSILAREQR